jgi:predicted DNA-binding transcriptional regulator AlpA
VPNQDDPWLTTADLAERYQATEATIRQWRHQRTGPRGVQIGKKVMYRLSEVLRWEHELEQREQAQREAAQVAS